jgi:threonine dehydrogenase-like Zn-dependent dehydrogenase
VGTEVANCKAGDRVSVEGYLPCGACHACLAGESNRCTAREQIGMTHNGGFAEFVVAPARSCHLLPAHIGLDEALMVEPASTVVRGVERVRPRAGGTAAIIGCGTIGLIAARVLSLYTPSAILGIDLAPDQENLACRAGMTEFTTIQDASTLKQRSRRDGWDLVVDCAQGEKPLQLAFEIVRPGGTILVIGGAPDSHLLRLPANVFVMRDLHVEGVLGYTTASWLRTLELLQEGSLKLGDLITHRATLDQFERAVELVESRSEPTGKIVIAFQNP